MLSLSRETLDSRFFLLLWFYLRLPAVMRKCLVGFRHAMNVFLLLHRSAAAVGRIQQFAGQLVDHALFAAGPAVGDQPADGERGAPLRIDFDRHLVIRAADATGLDFEQWLAVLNRLLEQLQGFI